MNTSGSEFNQTAEMIDDEDCFGFHSEYYIDPEWRDKSGMEGPRFASCYPGRGYARYSKYLDDIYFIHHDYGADSDYVIKANVKQKEFCTI